MAKRRSTGRTLLPFIFSFLLTLISLSNAHKFLKNYIPALHSYDASEESPSSPSTLLSSSHKGSVREFLDLHNKVRSHMKEPPFQWDHRVARFARRFANKRRSDCQLIHSGGPYGENLFWGSGSDFRAGDAVHTWVSEHKHYNRTANSCVENEKCGHFTQIVWKQSVKLGCARVECIGGGVFITCNYDPPGNYVGDNPFN